MKAKPDRSSAPVRLVRPAEDWNLVSRCVAGEQAALRELFERERSHVHALLYRVVGSNTNMDDLIQDTFLEVFRSLGGFRGDSSLRTWIDRCAVRVAYAHFAKRRRSPVLQPVTDVAEEGLGVDERTSLREAVRRLYLELDRLEPRQRMAYMLFAIENRSLRQVAEIMESSLPTAKIRVWRASRALAQRARIDPLLAEFLNDGPQNRKDTT